MIKKLKFKKEIFGYIIRYKKKNGVNFLTPSNLNHQIAAISHKKNHIISKAIDAKVVDIYHKILQFAIQV